MSFLAEFASATTFSVNYGRLRHPNVELFRKDIYSKINRIVGREIFQAHFFRPNACLLELGDNITNSLSFGAVHDFKRTPGP